MAHCVHFTSLNCHFQIFAEPGRHCLTTISQNINFGTNYDLNASVDYIGTSGTWIRRVVWLKRRLLYRQVPWGVLDRLIPVLLRTISSLLLYTEQCRYSRIYVESRLLFFRFHRDKFIIYDLVWSVLTHKR